jgi:hypothetical protein
LAQDFWASSGFGLLARGGAALRPTAGWIGAFLDREELRPPEDAGPRERELHRRVRADPLAKVPAAALASVEDADARENWSEFLRFRERVMGAASLEACYRDLFRRKEVDLAPPFVDALAQSIVRGLLDGTEDPWICRAGEMFFRRQRIASEEGKVLVADAATIEVFAETGGFGNVGRLLRQQNTPVPAVKMDVLNHENAQLYFMRDELYGFALDLAPAGRGAAALARMLERWIAHMAGVEVAIEPVARVEDRRWRWHVGLDVDSTAILNALYRGEDVPAEDLERMALLFRLEFRDPAEAIADLGRRPVYLGLACRPERTLKLKPQNLLINLPLAGAN